MSCGYAKSELFSLTKVLPKKNLSKSDLKEFGIFSIETNSLERESSLSANMSDLFINIMAKVLNSKA